MEGKIRTLWIIGLAAFLSLPQPVFAFDHSHARWGDLLKGHVHWDEKFTDDKQRQQRIRAGDTPIAFLFYDWTLNDYRK